MQSVLIVTDLPMDKELTHKAMAAVYGGNGMGSAAPSLSTTSAANTPFTTSYTGALPGYANSNSENVRHMPSNSRIHGSDIETAIGMLGYLELMGAY